MFLLADSLSFLQTTENWRVWKENSTEPDNAADKGDEWHRRIKNGVQISSLYNEIYDNTSDLNKTEGI